MALVLSALQELATGLRWSPDDAVLMLWAYMDESGIHDRQGGGPYRHLVVGGAIAELNNWEELGRRWEAALRDEGVAEFHMAPFEAYADEFVGWTQERHRDFLNRLLDIIHGSNIRACFGAGVVAPPPPQQVGRDWFPTIYGECVRRLLANLLWQADFLGETDRRIQAVFAKHAEIDYHRLAYYFEAISKGLPRHIAVATGDPARVVQLQVADLVIYEAARWLYDPDPLYVPRRYPLRSLHARGMSVVLHKVIPRDDGAPSP